MADRYLLETSAVDGYLLEDGSGVLILEAAPAGGDDVAPFIGGGYYPFTVLREALRRIWRARKWLSPGIPIPSFSATIVRESNPSD